MGISDTIRTIEGRVKSAGITVDEFCAQAHVDRATWQRWKAGKTVPRLDAWTRVTECAGKLRRRAHRSNQSAE